MQGQTSNVENKKKKIKVGHSGIQRNPTTLPKAQMLTHKKTMPTQTMLLSHFIYFKLISVSKATNYPH